MKNILIVLFALISVTLISCTNKQSEKQTKDMDKSIESDHQHVDSAAVLELNNGAKWVVSREMKPHLLNGVALVRDYIQNKQTDYRALALQLKEKNSQLLNSCNMSGKGHDELHKWLIPHMELVDNLENATNETEANDFVRKLEKSYSEYQNYFE